MNAPTSSSNNAVLLQVCTLADIEKMINEAVGERMEAFVQSISQRPPQLIKRKVAAQRLGISLPTLDAYAKAGFLHARHVGGRVYFDEADVEKYAQNQKPRKY